MTESKNKKEKTKKSLVIRIISYSISILCLIACILITVEVIQANRESRPPRVFGLSVSHVPTSSMEPTINAGEYVLYSKASFSDVDVGDIIVYKSASGIYIIHRIIEKNEDYLLTKGDNNAVADTEKITSGMVYGKYIMTIGILSIFSGGISKNFIFFALILIFIAMIAMQVISIILKSKTEKLNKTSEVERNLLIEELKKQILEEELEKIRKNKNDTD